MSAAPTAPDQPRRWESQNAAQSRRWEDLYNRTPLCDVPRHFAGMNRSPFLREYLTEVLRRCPRGGRTLEAGVGSGYGAVWLSLRGVCAEGLDSAPRIVERARRVNDLLEGKATFRLGDLFRLYDDFHSVNDLQPDPSSPCSEPPYQVIHHQGVLEHCTAPQIQAALAQQTACARWVVFSVPSVYYPFEPEFGDERLLPLDEWQRLLAPFDVADLRYYGDPALGGREHVLCVLRGQPVDDALLALMRAHEAPFPAGISAIVHTRNEAKNIADCLATLSGWTDEIIVCDMESDDDTLEIARRFTDNVLLHPLLPHFDRARNASAMRARYRWVFFLDADERVPPGLGAALRRAIAQDGDTFEGLLVPFRHHFAGQWLRCLYPGYTAPRLLKNGAFVFRPRLHAGADVAGRVACFPADDPALAITHYSFASLSHYLDKLNRYTDGEAEGMHRDGAAFGWRQAVGSFVRDFQDYYDRGNAAQDGVHGFLYSFLSGFYRFEQHAKLYERRFRQGQLSASEQAVPSGVAEVLEYALSVARQEPPPAPPSVLVSPGGASVVWSGPLWDRSGYGQMSRGLLLALDGAGAAVAAQPLPWGEPGALPEGEQARLDALARMPAAPGFVQVVHTFPPLFAHSLHPAAGVRVGCTLFETDRLPAEWVAACNGMDAVWVPTEFNRRTFAAAGVDAEKLAVVPLCLDPAPYRARAARPRGKDAARDGLPPAVRDLRARCRFLFLAAFDWTWHKGWDALLAGFLDAFAGREDVGLALKVWSTLGHSEAAMRAQAAGFAREERGHDLADDPRIAFVFDRLDADGMLSLYGASDGYALPSRGEGWGLPYLEAMACGLPSVGPNWGGNTAFMTKENSFLVDCALVPVPEAGWREVPAYRGIGGRSRTGISWRRHCGGWRTTRRGHWRRACGGRNTC